jgi:putative Ca2+/H+ antiporter (TMEM165/GDT1 family)
MNIKLLMTVFTTVFLAELGDKTQLATLLFAGNKDISKMTVFIGASLALILTSAIGVLFGSTISTYLNTKYINYIAGAGFILIGVWTIIKA